MGQLEIGNLGIQFKSYIVFMVTYCWKIRKLFKMEIDIEIIRQ